MPSPTPSMGLAEVREHIANDVFGQRANPHCDLWGRNGVGIELEFLTGASGFSRLGWDKARALLAELDPLPEQSRLTVEPGGQLELSTQCFSSVDIACEAAAVDLFHLDRVCAVEGVELVALGADPIRVPERVVTAPRYRAMEEYFDSAGPAGRTMMCNSAAIQINLGLGRDVGSRWALANHLGPTLIACFANSPFALGAPTGWKSSRLRCWWSLDHSRSKPVPAMDDPVDAWTDYALAARVMLIRQRDQFHPQTAPLSFSAWITDGHELGWPTLEDWCYHLTTLFPPVRPRGWLELRMFDALPTPFWQVAVAVTHALVTDPEVAEDARRAVSSVRDLWVDAAQMGLTQPDLGAAGRACFQIALDSLERRNCTPAIVEAVASYNDRWVARGRCPADDRYEEWRRAGNLLPYQGSPVLSAGGLTGRVSPR